MAVVEPRTLDRRLAEGKMSASEALRVAAGLAAALREKHDAGQVHGALSPACIELSPSGVTLRAGRMPLGLVNPYIAPEILRGHPADVRSDIFSFGAIVYEMITGHWPFEADTPEALGAAILNSPAPGTGNPPFDGLLANCLAKDPAARWQRIQKAQMELRLLSVSARRLEGASQGASVEALVRSEMQSVESRLTVRMESQAKALSELQQAVSASLQAVQTHLCSIDAKLASAQERMARYDEGAAEIHLRISGCEQRLADGPKESLGRLELLLQAATERVSRAEQTADATRRQTAEVAESSSVRIHALEQALRSQSESLESARHAMAQTDDLVERVVEALDSLQSIVLERPDAKPPAVN